MVSKLTARAAAKERKHNNIFGFLKIRNFGVFQFSLVLVNHNGNCLYRIHIKQDLLLSSLPMLCFQELMSHHDMCACWLLLICK